MLIRIAKAGDAQAIEKLAAEFHAYLNSLGDKTKFFFNASTYLRDGFGENPAFVGLVAESDQEVFGYLILHSGYDTDHSRRLAYIVDLFVTERWRGKGAGKALMKSAGDLARAQGAETLWWGVYEPNDFAIRFYEGLGARHVKGIRFMAIDVDSLNSPAKSGSSSQ